MSSAALREISIRTSSAASRYELTQPVAPLIGESDTLLQAIDLARHVALSPATNVLVVGETGSGKELLARFVHSSGPNAGQPFVAVNCAAIPENLLEAELFGYERGAFTDARTDKLGLIECAAEGTLFLDEIGEMPMHLQPKLLRVLESRSLRRLGGTAERSVRCRIIAGTNRDLEQGIAEARFREDLYYRLNVFRIDLPPLRERVEDVPVLAQHFLRELGERRGGAAKELDDSALELLCKHTWPGNVRELKNVIERACLLAHGNVVRARDLSIQRRDIVPARAIGAAGCITIPAQGMPLVEIEREAIRVTMIITGGNLTAAARILGISRPRLLRRMAVSGLTRRSILAST